MSGQIVAVCLDGPLKRVAGAWDITTSALCTPEDVQCLQACLLGFDDTSRQIDGGRIVSLIVTPVVEQKADLALTLVSRKNPTKRRNLRLALPQGKTACGQLCPYILSSTD